MIGKTISHYKIVAKLGEGGMGVVYQADDTKLKRSVALKFLSANLMGSGDEKQRFLQEAQAAAALNHTNIAIVYEIDEAELEGTKHHFMAMEHISGQSLHDLKKPLPLSEAIDYANQIAVGLQHAHEAGIIHRDIKSANIMVTDKGQIKIMDFGLAKLSSAQSFVTKEGTTLGTAAYMSPEQARGEKADQRSDIWSLGVVLYEMIAGQLPFKGDYEQAVVYGILSEEPEPLTALRSGLPVALDGIIVKALAKDPKTRYQHVDELPADLRALDTSTVSSRIASPGVSGPARTSAAAARLPWSLFGAAVLALVAAVVLLWPTPQQPEPVVRFGIPYETNLIVAVDEAGEVGRLVWPQLAISIDGSKIAYTRETDMGRREVLVRDLNEIVPTRISSVGSEGGSPWFSPDGNWVIYYDGRKLMKVAISGGTPIPLNTQASSLHGDWGRDGRIVYTPAYNLGLWTISETGDEPTMLTAPDSSLGEAGHRFPQILPDGEHVLFTIKPTSSNFDEASIGVVNLETGVVKRLFKGGSFARFAPTGHLLYVHNRQLHAIGFDLDRLETKGDAKMILESVHYAVGFGTGQYAVSHTGTLIYLPHQEIRENSQLAWLDRQGNPSLIPRELGSVLNASLSPDGTSIALVIAEDFSNNLWMYDLPRDILTRFTFEGIINGPVWTRDGKTVTFSDETFVDAVGSVALQSIYSKGLDGTPRQRLVSAPYTQFPGSWTPDGKTFVYALVHPKSSFDIWLVHAEEGRKEVYLDTDFDENDPILSPDGRWLAYISNESGQYEVYLQSYPDKSRKIAVSDRGGIKPFWSSDGKELFFHSGQRLMVVDVSQDPTFNLGAPRELFEPPEGFHLTGSMSSDGRRFLALRREIAQKEADSNIVIVLNWHEELKRIMDEN